MESSTFASGPLLLEGRIQKYEWGDSEYLPRLLGLERPEGPYAELWLGAHPALPSLARVGGKSLPLDALISSNAEAILGSSVARRFGRLPYLLKILAAARPLSIQVHPSKAQAVEGFAREDAAGVARDSPVRNYRDDNHKPEILVALTPFFGLAGFRPVNEIATTLASLGEIAELLPRFDENAAGLRKLVEAYFALPDEKLCPALSRLLARLQEETSTATWSDGDPRVWALVADREFSRHGKPDRGLLFVFLLNLVRLSPGQGLFLPACLPHAYLRGSGVELMANSDNVLRCGLTPKHVDTAELLRIVQFESMSPPIVEADVANGEGLYRTPVEEFELHRIDLTPGEAADRSAHGPETLLALSKDAGCRVEIKSRSGVLTLGRAGACLVPDGVDYRVTARGAASVYRVTAPSRRI